SPLVCKSGSCRTPQGSSTCRSRLSRSRPSYPKRTSARRWSASDPLEGTAAMTPAASPTSPYGASPRSSKMTPRGIANGRTPAMLLRPKFKSHLRVQVVEGEGVFLLWETGQAVLEGQVYRLLVPYIDGRHTSDQIIEQLQEECSPSLLYYALAQMEGRGYLDESD